MYSITVLIAVSHSSGSEQVTHRLRRLFLGTTCRLLSGSSEAPGLGPKQESRRQALGLRQVCVASGYALWVIVSGRFPCSARFRWRTAAHNQRPSRNASSASEGRYLPGLAPSGAIRATAPRA